MIGPYVPLEIKLGLGGTNNECLGPLPLYNNDDAVRLRRRRARKAVVLEMDAAVAAAASLMTMHCAG